MGTWIQDRTVLGTLLVLTVWTKHCLCCYFKTCFCFDVD